MGIYTKVVKSYHKDSTKFIAALFRIARTWKQARCPSNEKCMKGMVVQLQNKELISYKSSDIMKFAGK